MRHGHGSDPGLLKNAIHEVRMEISRGLGQDCGTFLNRPPLDSITWLTKGSGMASHWMWPAIERSHNEQNGEKAVISFDKFSTSLERE